ncbi:hypothetical protein RSOLAG1IB_02741 [Rhizoctonia solani AG-1 IB]|uniref:Uncharacterized protein n=2 Tax=Thanatephorus cucumeris (strain AG1-IB / isolate 7/3/14) TaxID=1108050 RepID=A0A0B7FJ20_THACB|nr:hypothetical protein RSOLAG1IB_02741 [Rhizoctonia solani AG-1 IB]
MGRPLWLHISALSPDEYEAYPPALEDIASFGQDDAKGDWESQSVSLLVAKGWMKGRYRDQLEGDVVDKILRYFYPKPVQTDCLSAGQFFAALRLISHAQRGHALDKSLVFIQARISNDNNGRVSPHKAKSLLNLRSVPPAPIRPSPVRPLQLAPDESISASDDRYASSGLGPSPVRGEPVLPKSAPAGGSSNPFRRTLSTPGDTTPNHFDIPPMPSLNPALVAEALASSSALVDEEGSPIRDKPATGLGRSLSTKTAPESPSNPFRRSSHSPAPPVRSQSPPLLPRRPPLPPPRDSTLPMLPPPRHPQQPVKPPKPSVSSKPKPPQMLPAGGTPSELIKQSLRAAKGAQRANEMSLEKQRTWEVIKSSAHGSSNSSGSGGVPQAFAQLTASNLRSLPHAPHPPPGPSTNASSLDRVATARPDPVPALPPVPPKPASHHGHSRATSTSRPVEAPMPGRPVRSKSLHHSPSHTPPNDTPIQPPPRRRPESIQFTGGQVPKSRAESPSPNPLSRRTSVRSQTFYDEVRRRAGELEPRLDAVRAKAEGKLSSKGYMTRRGKGEQGEPLVDLEDEGGSIVSGDVDWREWDREDDAARRFRSSPTGGLSVDRDEPTSDYNTNGWRPLAG